MAYKPVGADENGKFPPRVDAAYASGTVHFIVSATAPAETSVNGKPVVWIDTSGAPTGPITVTATAPTFNDGTDTYTIPTTTGVDYKVAGVTKAAGSYGVTAPATVVVDAVAKSGYTLTGTIQWTGTFTVSADVTAPTVPTNLAGTAGTTTMDLTWTASTDAVGVTGYRVSKDNGATWITSAVTGTTYSVTGLTASTSYTFAVAARDAAGNWSTNTTLAQSTTAGVTYAEEVTTDAPTTYLAFDGTTANTGSVAETYTPTALTYGASLGDGTQAGVFNGTSTKLSAPQTATAGLNSTTAWSVEALVNPASFAAAGQVGMQTATWGLALTTLGKIALEANAGAAKSSLTTTAALVAGAVSHVAATWDGTTMRAYINGAEAASTAFAGPMNGYGTAPPQIGSNGSASWFNGSIDGYALYRNKALTPARILAHAQAAGVA